MIYIFIWIDPIIIIFIYYLIIFIFLSPPSVQKLLLHIPDRFKPDNCQQHTLLDGELVVDVVKKKKEDGSEITQKVCRYLIYDAISIEAATVSPLNLLERLKRVFQHVVVPRREWEQKHPEIVEQEKKNKCYLEIYLKV